MYIGLNLHSLMFFFFLIIIHTALVFVRVFICDEPSSVFLFVVLSAGCAVKVFVTYRGWCVSGVLPLRSSLQGDII